VERANQNPESQKSLPAGGQPNRLQQSVKLFAPIHLAPNLVFSQVLPEQFLVDSAPEKIENGTIILISPTHKDVMIKHLKDCSEKGIKAVSLGHQRLRTETAGIFVAAWTYEKMI
jgi:hypothetical protein